MSVVLPITVISGLAWLRRRMGATDGGCGGCWGGDRFHDFAIGIRRKIVAKPTRC